MESLSVTAVYGQSWSAARTVLASRPRFYWMWMAAAALVGALSLLVPDSIFQSTNGQPQIAAAIPVCLIGFGLFVTVLAYFVLADAVRTFLPAFQMTVPVFFLALVINWAYSFAIQVAMYCLVIPAFYVGPKLWLWLPNYLLYGVESSDLAQPFKRAWLDTNNLYWPTFGLMALITIVSTAIAFSALGIAALLIQLFHPLAILAMPFLLAVVLYLIAQVDWAWLAWAAAVRRHADALAATAVAVTIARPAG